MAASLAGKALNFTSRPRILLRAWKNHRTSVAVLFSTDNNEPNSGPEEDSTESTKRDPFPLFASGDVQSLLQRIAGFDVTKVAGPHLKAMQRPTYKLLTDSELEQEQENASERLKYRLQMPPYMNARDPKCEDLANDSDLAGFDTAKYVFVDCSFGVKDRQRSVVVRDADGSLREASWDVKERMNQMFNPREGRSVIKPKMFDEQNVEKMIHLKQYNYILSRACAQFEPDDPDFIRTSHRVYNAVNSTTDFEHLRSTRFFGPMAFYLCWYRMCDSLVTDMLNRDLLDDAVDVVRLYCLIHTESSCAESVKSLDTIDPEVMLKAYIDTEADTKSDLRTSLQALLDRRASQEKSALSS